MEEQRSSFVLHNTIKSYLMMKTDWQVGQGYWWWERAKSLLWICSTERVAQETESGIKRRWQGVQCGQKSDVARLAPPSTVYSAACRTGARLRQQQEDGTLSQTGAGTTVWNTLPTFTQYSHFTHRIKLNKNIEVNSVNCLLKFAISNIENLKMWQPPVLMKPLLGLGFLVRSRARLQLECCGS